MSPLAIVSAFAVSAAPPNVLAGLEAVPADGGIHVHVSKRGLFSGFAHDHDFEVTRWHGTAQVPDGDPGRAVLELDLVADSLRDREKGLSEGDRRKVDAQAAGPEVLDAVRHPHITYRSASVALDARSPTDAGSVRGTMHGTLTLRGRTRPVDATFEASRKADAWRVNGKARLRQSDFGIQPFSGFGGTVGVKDEVEVTFALTLQPRGGGPAAAP
jgi:polyisoprenoid-binding protein YceI